MSITSSESDDEQISTPTSTYKPTLADRIPSSGTKQQQNSLSAEFWPEDGVLCYDNPLIKENCSKTISNALSWREPHGGNCTSGNMSAYNTVSGRGSFAGETMKVDDTIISINPLSEPLQHYIRVEEGRSEDSDDDFSSGISADGDQQEEEPSCAEEDSQPRQPDTPEKNSTELAASKGLAVDNCDRPRPPPVPSPPMPASMSHSDLRDFAMKPGPRNNQVMCYIVRDKGSTKMYPKYTLYLEHGRRLMMTARKTKKQAGSSYELTFDGDTGSKNARKPAGKLRSNFLGTEFSMYGLGGKKPAQGSLNGLDEDEDDFRAEMGCVVYQYNVLGARGPRKMTCALPYVADEEEAAPRAPRDFTATMVERLVSGRDTEDLMVMQNKYPRWNQTLNAYCLNFRGRVTEASVKNFQLVKPSDPSYIVLQFGKTSKNQFTMDYQWPMSAFQAFCTCLSSFDNKLACE